MYKYTQKTKYADSEPAPASVAESYNRLIINTLSYFLDPRRLVFHARHRQAGCKDKQGCDSFHRFVIIYNRYSYAREEVGGTSYL